MIADGIFIHHLVRELNDNLKNKRINKVFQIDNYSFLFNIQNKLKLYTSVSPNNCHLKLTNNDYIQIATQNPFYQNLKKITESSIIKSITQINNDRIIKLEIEYSDDLGYKETFFLFFELFGRNANLIITSSDLIITDVFRKTFLLEDSSARVLIPKSKYDIASQDKVNPFNTNEIIKPNNYEGVSNLVYTEIINENSLTIINKLAPQIINKNNKLYFSAINLNHLNGEVRYFNTLSEVLDTYYSEIKELSIYNADQRLIETYLNKEIIKTKKKITKQKQDYKKAEENLKLEQLGNLLSANLHLVKKNSKSITVSDFYNNNEEVTISLDPLLSPAKNLENIFNRYKKAKRAITFITEQINNSKNDILYYETLLNQLELSKLNELKEIIEELKLKQTNTKSKKKQKPQILTLIDADNNTILVGKNNIQNNYITHTLGKKHDYFFHVRGVPGSHVILKTNDLTKQLITLAATIASYYSKSRNSNNVAVDYTKVSHVKKVGGQKGSFVTYSKEKTVYVDPDLDFINKYTKVK